MTSIIDTLKNDPKSPELSHFGQFAYGEYNGDV